MSFCVIIPTRYDSMRLPGKALVDIHGQSMIERVWRRAKQSLADEVIIATDSNAIFDAAQSFGAHVVMTSKCQSGSDRVYQAAKNIHLDPETIIVNVQGDEPLIPIELINRSADLAIHTHAMMSTLCVAFTLEEDRANLNAVKTIFDKNNRATYFGREDKKGAYRHIGIYAYSLYNLQLFCHLSPSEQEQQQRLEQLRFVGTKDYSLQDICVTLVDIAVPHGVDSPQDLELVRQLCQSQ